MPQPSSAEPATQRTAARRSFTRQIGEVIVTVEIPADCPDPVVTLTLHAHATSATERVAALAAFGMTPAKYKSRGGTLWCERHVAADEFGPRQIEATVFLDETDVLPEARS